jgi:hypothetical protein
LQFARALALVTALVAAAPAAPAPDSLLEAAVRAGYDQDYRQAMGLLAQVPAVGDAAPAVAFWRAALVQLLLYDSGDPVLADSFYRLSDRAAAAAESCLAAEPDNPAANVFLGMTQLNRANLQGWQQQRWQALRTMLGVERFFRRAYGLDSTLADARLGLGIIEYFKATVDRYLFGLKLFGSRDRAYRLLEGALTDDARLRDAGEFVLTYMRKEDGEYDLAAGHSLAILRRHPGNRTALRMLREVRLKAGDYRLVLMLGQHIEASIRASYPRNRYGLAENRIAMAKAWAGLGEPDSVVALCDSIIAWEPVQDSVPWLRSYVAEARSLRRRAGGK